MNRQFPAFPGLAILFVLFNHAITMGLVMPERFGHAGPSPALMGILLALKEIGLIAVPIFLFLSGAFLVFALQNRTWLKSYRVVGANLIQIMIPYLLWSIVFYVMIFFLLGERYTAGEYLKNILVGYPFNFIPLLIFFYLIAPVLIRVAQRFPALLLLLILIYQLVLFNSLVPGALGFLSPAWIENIKPSVIWSTLATWGIFFPLGLVYNLHGRRILPGLTRLKWMLAALVVAFFALSMAHELDMINFPVADLLGPLAGICLLPLVPRERIPQARRLENLGKRAYGLYLTNLIIFTLVTYGFQHLLPQFLDLYLISIPFLFFAALFIPQLVMRGMERYPARTGYRYVFG